MNLLSLPRNRNKKGFWMNQTSFYRSTWCGYCFSDNLWLCEKSKEFFRIRFMTFNLARNVFLGASSFALEASVPRAEGGEGEPANWVQSSAIVTRKAFQKPEHANFISNILVEAGAGASPINILSPMNVKLLKSLRARKNSEHLRSHSCRWCVPSCLFGVC